uniref:DUF6418 domain-containing protein n=1 Tax=Curvibacter symbiont subsp. Hydra magnipapillata TaxID=667019 RepID=C9Y8C1_CURXX|nr:hypothetical protein Csp_A03720 [Curvibacter putative symbiont of Hydra magnipapillata]
MAHDHFGGMSSDAAHGPRRYSLVDVFLWGTILANIAVAIMLPNLISSGLATALYLILLSRIFKKSPLGFLLFSPIIFLHFSALISLNAIEAGAYMKEMGRLGHASAAGATWVLVVGVFIWVATSVFTHNRKAPTKPTIALDASRHRFIGTWAAPLVVCLFILWLLMKGASTGFPLIDGFDRFAYRRVAGDPITLNILNLKVVISAFLALSAVNCNTAIKRNWHHVIFAAYLGTSFLFGDKFFIIISASLYYVAIQLAFRPEIIARQAKRFFLPATGALLVAIAMTVYIYSGLGTYGVDKTFQLLIERFASQGQLWFIAFTENFHWIGFDTYGVKENLNALIENPHQDYVFEKRLSAFYFIETYAPSKMFLSFVGNQGYVAPTGVFEAYMIEMFGFFGGLTVVALAATLLGCIARCIRYAVTTGNPFTVLLPAYILVQFYYLIAAGTPFNVFGASAFKAYAAFATLQWAVTFWVRKTDLSNAGRSEHNSTPLTKNQN